MSKTYELLNDDLVILFKEFCYSQRQKNIILVLKQLSKEREVYQYRLAKKIKCSYRTSLRILHFLKKKGYAEIIKKEPSSKRGKENNVWSLTAKGKSLLELLIEPVPNSVLKQYDEMRLSLVEAERG